MWFEDSKVCPPWNAAARALAKADPKLGRLIATVGPCTLRRRRDYFVVLAKAIFSQQISTAVARVLFARFRKQFPAGRPTPQRVLDLLSKNPQAARRCGLSRQKEAYLLDLARHFVTGEIPTRRFARMEDEQIIQSLVRVKGVGRWTAEMFLIFVLNRPNVLPVDDLGLRKGIQKLRRLKELPKPKQCTQIGRRWHPHRSLATWYLWRSLDGK
ncbi:MAG: DNA-3-methyladenine glycosylase 2 family protein [Phycisphaerales bacterium]|nr:DNA-3-methyladenine glycosylase 2 family protein [Phycisphaerales bacterium]